MAFTFHVLDVLWPADLLLTFWLLPVDARSLPLTVHLPNYTQKRLHVKLLRMRHAWDDAAQRILFRQWRITHMVWQEIEFSDDEPELDILWNTGSHSTWTSNTEQKEILWNRDSHLTLEQWSRLPAGSPAGRNRSPSH